MFSGIIEDTGAVVSRVIKDGIMRLTVRSNISKDAYVDQSISHNGTCLTVIETQDNTHTIEAVPETLERTNLSQIEVGDLINLERSVMPTTRLDGHIVQGHIDTTVNCLDIVNNNGSKKIVFSIPDSSCHLVVDKGSICLNGISLTVISPDEISFRTAIIPYTMDHTNFKNLAIGDAVNVEFDIIGKYVARMLSQRN